MGDSRKGQTVDLPEEGLALGRRCPTFGVVACVQEVAVTPGELLADADLIHYTMGAREMRSAEWRMRNAEWSCPAYALARLSPRR
jgi:hypothetical protein